MFFIGITLEKEAFRVAVLKKEKKNIAILDLKTVPFGPEDVKLFYKLPPFQTGKKAQIVSGLSSAEIFVRKLHLPLKEKRKILSALPFQLETLVPFSTEQAIICPLLKPLSKQMTAVTIIAATRELLSAHLNALKQIKPDQVSCQPTAQMRFAHWQFPNEQRVLSFHAEDQNISCVLSEGNELILSQSISARTNEEREFELDKLSIFLKQKGIVLEQTPWLLTGDTHLLETLKKLFPGPQLELNDAMLRSFAIAVGYALDGLLYDESTVQFCQQEFLQQHTQRFRKKTSLAYLAIWLTAMLVMGMGGSLMLGKKQQHLTERLNNYLPTTLTKEQAYSAEEIEQKLLAWEKSLNRNKLSFPFLLTAPKVSDVLAWLSTHPAFATEEGNPKEGVDIKSLHYYLVKYPKVGDPSAPYLGQMELEFTALTPRIARDFHDALLKGDLIVNAKKEVKWQTQNQTYLTSFELNRGIAP